MAIIIHEMPGVDLGPINEHDLLIIIDKSSPNGWTFFNKKYRCASFAFFIDEKETNNPQRLNVISTTITSKILYKEMLYNKKSFYLSSILNHFQ